MHSDGKKHHSFLTLLFTAGDLRRSAKRESRAISDDNKGSNHDE